MIELILFITAGYIIFHLWNMLGTRTGFEKDIHVQKVDKTEHKEADIVLEPGQFRSLEGISDKEGLSDKITLFEKKQPSFVVKDFLESAKKAFTIIVESYYRSDWETLRELVSDQVLKMFQDRPAQETKIIFSVEAEIYDVHLFENEARIIVLFRSNQNNVWIVDHWIFEKPYEDTKWILVGTLKS